MLYDVTIHSERCHTNSIESCFGSGPLVLPKQAHIHPHPPPSSPPYQRQAGKRGRRKIDAIDVKRGAGGRSGGEMREGGQARLGERQGRVIVHVPPLTSEEKLQANTAIEKQRSICSPSRFNHNQDRIMASFILPMCNVQPTLCKCVLCVCVWMQE